MIDIEHWIENALENVKLEGITQDIHIDEIIGNSYKKIKKHEIFNESYAIFSKVVNQIVKRQIDTFGIGVYLTIGLISESNCFLGKPESFNELIEMIETFSVPEIIIYKDKNPYEIPLTELYRMPLFFDLEENNKHIQIFYKECRSLEDQVNNGDYMRDLSLIYMPVAK